MNKQFFISGIGTGVGKTIVSAIFTQAFQADYWKPIQSGDLQNSDSMCVNNLISSTGIIHPERFKLQLAASPHQSAKEENIEIKLTDFQLPQTQNNLIVEGAGGLFVPISDDAFVIDVIQKLNLPVVLVARDYLGCINHTILSIEALNKRNIPIEYFVFNGDFVPETKRIIRKYLSNDIKVIQISEITNLNKQEINQQALQII